MSFKQIYLAVYYCAAFAATPPRELCRWPQALELPRWLERHLVESAATARGERVHGY